MAAELRNYDPSLREKIAWWVAENVGGILGAGKYAKQDIAGKTGGVLDVVPILGDTVGANEAYRDYQEGNYSGAALGGGLAALGLIPGAGDVAAAGVKKGIKAYHGSPHDFDKFSLDKIGTGEGAQAYGHGLYFAEGEGVAKSYRDALSSGSRGSDAPRFRALGNKPLGSVHPDVAHDIAEKGVSAIDARLAEIQDTLKNEAQNRRFFGDQQTDEMIAVFRREMDELNALKATGDFSVNKGHMYEVNINANPDEFLDWDAPLAQQPHILPRLNEAGSPVPATPDLSYLREQAAKSGPDSWYAEQLRSMEDELSKPGSAFVPRNDESLRLMQKAGIPGIKYLDQGSRTKGDGTRNYVVFDDKLIEIVRKYGLAAAIASGVISAEMGRQMQAQGDI